MATPDRLSGSDMISSSYALLACRTFTKSEEVGRQTWRIHFSRTGVRMFCEMPSSASICRQRISILIRGCGR
jgi:hypothetical protein